MVCILSSFVNLGMCPHQQHHSSHSASCGAMAQTSFHHSVLYLVSFVCISVAVTNVCGWVAWACEQSSLVTSQTCKKEHWTIVQAVVGSLGPVNSLLQSPLRRARRNIGLQSRSWSPHVIMFNFAFSFYGRIKVNVRVMVTVRMVLL